MRVWRALKALGPAVLRDGVYLLPARDDLATSLAEQQAEVQRAGGQAYIFPISPAADDVPMLRRYFDRTDELGKLIVALRQFTTDDCLTLSETETRRALLALQREFKTVAATDYFPGRAHDEAKAALAHAEAAFLQRFSAGEPHAEQRDIPRLDPATVQSRVWATRERLWVDRVASAWLIRRFIDRNATFRWLSDARDCPPDALGFDFDGATFTHIGQYVTFEVLLNSFGLEGDTGLARLATMVHALDIAGSSYSAEAAGFEKLLAGARATCATDDDLVGAVFPMLDLLYAGFARESDRSTTTDA